MKTLKFLIPFNINDTNEHPNITFLCAILKGNEPYIYPVRCSGIELKASLLTELKLCAMKYGFSLMLCSAIISKSELELCSQTCSLYCQYGIIYRAKQKYCQN